MTENRLYYDPETGQALYTTSGTSFPKSGHYILLDEPIDNTLPYRVLDGQLYFADLEPYRVRARAKLTDQVRQMREPLVTSLPGQDMVYLRKEHEAGLYLQDPDPDMANYPLLEAEVGITAETAYQLAQLWLNMSQIWRTAAAQLERYRLGTLARIDAAMSVAELEEMGFVDPVTPVLPPYVPPTDSARVDDLERIQAETHAALNRTVEQVNLNVDANTPNVSVEQRAEVYRWFASPTEPGPDQMNQYPLLGSHTYPASFAVYWLGIMEYEDYIYPTLRAIADRYRAEIDSADLSTNMDLLLANAEEELWSYT